MVTEAEDLCYVLKIRVLQNQVPISVVLEKVEISDGHLNPPIILVVHFHMPMYLDWAHMLGAPHRYFTVSFSIRHLEFVISLVISATTSANRYTNIYNTNLYISNQTRKNK